MGQRPVTVGMFFSLGHSTVVCMTCLVIAITSAAIADKLHNFEHVGGVIGVSVSMSFLLIIGFANLYVLFRLVQDFIKKKKEMERGSVEFAEEEANGNMVVVPEEVRHSGLLFRAFGRLFRLVSFDVVSLSMSDFSNRLIDLGRCIRLGCYSGLDSILLQKWVHSVKLCVIAHKLI